MDIQCVCGTKYDKKEFKKHYKNCCKLLEKFKDFDFKISQLIKKYYKLKNASIIQFLLQRYIKLIEHKIRKSQEDNNHIRKIQSYENKNKNLEYIINPFCAINTNINDNKDDYKINNNSLTNSNNINNNMINNSINYFNKTENPLNIKCTVKPKKFKPKNLIKEIINKININNKENVFIKCNDINFTILNNKEKKTDLKMFLKKLSFNGSCEPEIVPDFKSINFKNCTPRLSFLGLNFKGEEKIILDYCKDLYMANQGIINNDIAKSISLYCKDLFSGEWLIIITNIDYIDIYFDLSSLRGNDKNMIFFLDNKKYYIIGC